jgi:hypothetical protein
VEAAASGGRRLTESIVQTGQFQGRPRTTSRAAAVSGGRCSLRDHTRTDAILPVAYAVVPADWAPYLLSCEASIRKSGGFPGDAVTPRSYPKEGNQFLAGTVRDCHASVEVQAGKSEGGYGHSWRLFHALLVRSSSRRDKRTLMDTILYGHFTKAASPISFAPLEEPAESKTGRQNFTLSFDTFPHCVCSLTCDPRVAGLAS